VAKEVIMPKLGMTMETGTIIRWFKEEGEPVQAGDVLLEVMTDKINIEVESYESGILLKRYYEADAVVPVNHVIAYIGAEGESVPDQPPEAGSTNQADEAASSSSSGEQRMDEPSVAAGDSDAGKVRATPAARRLARERGVPLDQIRGSGERGRIHRADVEAYLEQHAVKATPLARKTAEAEGIDLRKVTGTGVHGKITKEDVEAYRTPAAASTTTDAVPTAETVKKLEGMRKIIAQRMAESAFTAPHVTLSTEVDMTRSIELRQSLLPLVEKQTGYRLSYTEVIIKAVALCLRRHPQMRVQLEGEYIRYVPDIHVGLAVAVDHGLLVPVIRHADQKGLAALTQESKTLAAMARENKLKPDQISGGTFTISNLGMYAVDVFTPIINQPESAILGVGRIVEKAVGVNGQIVLRPMMTLSLSFDHRLIDGAPAAAFLTDLKRMLENPYELLI
jgi:Pyruvate/2-oxoglutarate dehydrogenase complex, dihydrolipoamide acyltransferase (E2) component, and related enzymes